METVVWVVFFYIFILLGFRLLGKREFSKLSAFEIVMLLLIPQLAQPAIIREDYSATGAVIALATLFILVMVTSMLTYRFRKAEHLVEGTPTVLAYDGRLLEDNLARERVVPNEVYTAMHRSGIADLAAVRWALLETDGRITVIPQDRLLVGNSSPHFDRPL